MIGGYLIRCSSPAIRHSAGSPDGRVHPGVIGLECRACCGNGCSAPISGSSTGSARHRVSNGRCSGSASMQIDELRDHAFHVWKVIGSG